MEKFDKKLMKKIPGYSGYYAYKNGRIYRKLNKEESYRQLAEYRMPYSAYLSVYIYRNKIKEGVQVHKLIASAYRGINYRNYKIFHKDKNPLNNLPNNLLIRKNEIKEKYGKLPYEAEIKDYESILKNYLNYDYNNPLWNEYKKLI
jgi:hypothetical protein